MTTPFFAHYADGGWSFEMRFEPGKGYFLNVPSDGTFLFLSRQEAAQAIADYLFHILSILLDITSIGQIVKESVKDQYLFDATMEDYVGLYSLLEAIQCT